MSSSHRIDNESRVNFIDGNLVVTGTITSSSTSGTGGVGFPAYTGTAGQALVLNNSGQLIWQTVSGTSISNVDLANMTTSVVVDTSDHVDIQIASVPLARFSTNSLVLTDTNSKAMIACTGGNSAANYVVQNAYDQVCPTYSHPYWDFAIPTTQTITSLDIFFDPSTPVHVGDTFYIIFGNIPGGYATNNGNITSTPQITCTAASTATTPSMFSLQTPVTLTGGMIYSFIIYYGPSASVRGSQTVISTWKTAPSDNTYDGPWTVPNFYPYFVLHNIKSAVQTVVSQTLSIANAGSQIDLSIAAGSTTYAVAFPSAAPAADQQLVSDANGALSWVTPRIFGSAADNINTVNPYEMVATVNNQTVLRVTDVLPVTEKIIDAPFNTPPSASLSSWAGYIQLPTTVVGNVSSITVDIGSYANPTPVIVAIYQGLNDTGVLVYGPTTLNAIPPPGFYSDAYVVVPLTGPGVLLTRGLPYVITLQFDGSNSVYGSNLPPSNVNYGPLTAAPVSGPASTPGAFQYGFVPNLYVTFNGIVPALQITGDLSVENIATTATTRIGTQALVPYQLMLPTALPAALNATLTTDLVGNMSWLPQLQIFGSTADNIDTTNPMQMVATVNSHPVLRVNDANPLSTTVPVIIVDSTEPSVDTSSTYKGYIQLPTTVAGIVSSISIDIGPYATPKPVIVGLYQGLNDTGIPVYGPTQLYVVPSTTNESYVVVPLTGFTGTLIKGVTYVITLQFSGPNYVVGSGTRNGFPLPAGVISGPLTGDTNYAPTFLPNLLVTCNGADTALQITGNLSIQNIATSAVTVINTQAVAPYQLNLPTALPTVLNTTLTTDLVGNLSWLPQLKIFGSAADNIDTTNPTQMVATVNSEPMLRVNNLTTQPTAVIVDVPADTSTFSNARNSWAGYIRLPATISGVLSSFTFVSNSNVNPTPIFVGVYQGIDDTGTPVYGPVQINAPATAGNSLGIPVVVPFPGIPIVLTAGLPYVITLEFDSNTTVWGAIPPPPGVITGPLTNSHVQFSTYDPNFVPNLSITYIVRNKDLQISGSLSIENPVTGAATTIGTQALTPYTLTLPSNSGIASQQLTTDGTGVSSWTYPVAQYVKFTPSTVTTSTTLDSHTLVTVDASAGPLTITFPPAATSAGLLYYIYKIDDTANTILIQPTSGDFYDKSTTNTVTLSLQDDSVNVFCTGARGWFTI